MSLIILISFLHSLAIAADVRDVLNTPPLVRQGVPDGAGLDFETLVSGSSNYADDILSSLELQFCGHSLGILNHHYLLVLPFTIKLNRYLYPSIGGALAVLAALDVSTNLLAMTRAAIILNMPSASIISKRSKVADFYDVRALQASMLPRISIYTYGTPRIGNSVFASKVEEAVSLEEYYRVEVDGDFIVNTPPAGYYYHGGTQVLVDAEGAGSIVVKPTIVESHLLGTSGSTLVNHGMTVYRKSLEACFEDSELREYLEKNHFYNDAMSKCSSEEDFPDWFMDRR